MQPQGLTPTAAAAVTQLTVLGAGGIAGGVPGAATALNEASNNAVIALPLLVDAVVAGGAAAARACVSSIACMNAVRLAGGTAVAAVLSLIPP